MGGMSRFWCLVGSSCIFTLAQVSGLTVNWGFMTLAPVIFGNIFNLAYGGIYDSHSVPSDNEEGHMVCEEGVTCYRGAYVFTFFSSIVGIGCALWCIWHEAYLRKKRAQEAE